MILREKYLSEIRPFYDSDLIKIITGVRIKEETSKRNYYRRNKKQPKPNWNGLLIDETFKYFPCLLD